MEFFSHLFKKRTAETGKPQKENHLQKSRLKTLTQSNKEGKIVTHSSIETNKSKPTAHNAYIFNKDYISLCQRKFISFDLETTGLDAWRDKIIEISAITYENGEEVDRFHSFINPLIHIPSNATEVNHITDEMVATAPLESDVINDLCHYLGADVLNGSIPLVAHNAQFDIKFLLFTLSNYGIEADLSYCDTLFLTKYMIAGLSNYKLGTIASYFNIDYDVLHNATTDAFLCGEIFLKLMDLKYADLHNRFSALAPLEQDICIWYKTILQEADCNTQMLCFNSTSTLTVFCLNAVVKFKPKAKKPFVLIDKRYSIPEGLTTSPCTKSEGENFIRVHYNTVSDLEPIKDFFIERYKYVFERALESINNSDKNMRAAAKEINEYISI